MTDITLQLREAHLRADTGLPWAACSWLLSTYWQRGETVRGSPVFLQIAILVDKHSWNWTQKNVWGWVLIFFSFFLQFCLKKKTPWRQYLFLVLWLLCGHARSLQLCPTLCSPIDCSLLGTSVHGILQARILEQAIVLFFRGSSQPKD